MKSWIEKIEYGLLFLFLLLIPSQLGKHFWFDWSLVLGIRIDYLSPVLYLTDILLVLIIVLNIIKNKGQTQGSAPTKRNGCIYRFGFIFIFWMIFLIFNLIFAQNKFIAGYKILKIIEFLGLFLYVKNNKEAVLDILKKVVPVWIVVEVGLVLMQVINGGSLQGVFYWLGERRMDLNTIGVAKWTIFNQEILRGYGTFSHPNSLAGFLFVSLVLWNLIIKNKKWWYWVVIMLGIMGIVLTGSRTVCVVGLLYLIIKPFVLRHSSKSTPFDQTSQATSSWQSREAKYKYLFVFLGIMFFLFMFKNVFSGWDVNSWNKRWDLAIYGWKMFLDHPVFGVGAGNFLSELPKYQKQTNIFWIQPVHNIVLLWIFEFGLVGLMFIGFMFKIINFKSKYFVLLLIILLTGMSDHYWLTLQQNSLLMVLILALL